MRWFIATITSLYKLLGIADGETSAAPLKTRPSMREPKDVASSKNDKVKREGELDDTLWKPWHHIWPKESNKASGIPIVNSCGKYAVKLFWMGTWRKIIVDDSVPTNADSKPLLPMTSLGSELWPALLCKALMKIVSLDYLGGNPNCEIGDVNLIHCMTGWIPEPVSLKSANPETLWELLLKSLPNWTLPPPPKPVEEPSPDVGRLSPAQGDKDEASKQELNSKDSKIEGPGKKEGSGKAKDRAKDKAVDKAEKDIKRDKEKGSPSTSALRNTKASEPELVLFASYSNPPKHPCQFSDLRDASDASEKLRLFGLSHNLSHPVQVNLVRNCPLVAPPVPIPVPRWKLIRQKKKNMPIEPPLKPEDEKEPKFLEIGSPFLYCSVCPTPTSRDGSPQKWDKFKPHTPMTSLNEEGGPIDSPPVYTGDETMETEKAESVQNISPTNLMPHPPNEPSKKSPTKEAIPSTLSKDGKSMKQEKNLSQEKKASRSPSALSQGSQKSAKSLRGLKASKHDASSKDGKKGAKDSDSKKPGKMQPSLSPEPVVTSESEEVVESVDESNADKSQESSGTIEEKKVVWMGFEDFCQCFSTLWFFHKPGSYMFSSGNTEIKSQDPKSEKRRGLGTTASGNVSTPSGRNAASSPLISSSLSLSTEPPAPFLFVDNTVDSEILINLSSMSRWFDPNLHLLVAGKEDAEKRIQQALTPVPGVLIVEPYSWKRLVTGNPVLTIRTTSSKSAVITLAPGRHLLRFIIQTPLGYHIQVCSKQSFVLGDEDTVMQQLKKESSRFTAHSTAAIQVLGTIIQSFMVESGPRRQDFVIGSEDLDNAIRRKHFEALFSSFTEAIKAEMGDTYAPYMTFALEALKFETFLHLKKFGREIRRQRAASVEPTMVQEEDSLHRITPVQRHTSLPAHLCTVPSSEAAAATKIQAAFRGFYTMKLKRAHKIGTVENTQTVEALNKIWQVIEPKLEAFAGQVYRSLFTKEPALFTIFPFFEDEWNKVVYADYSGQYPDQQADTWFVMVREVFYASKDVLCVPKFHCALPSCSLRVIDNDNREELRRIFTKIAPQIIKKNKNGYTFIVEGKTPSYPVPSGKFRLRLIGDKSPLPLPVEDGLLNTHFISREMQEYYMPNKYKMLFRYSVKTSIDICSTIQLGTSKTGVYLKLQVLDGEEELYATEGKGHVVIPSFFFLKDIKIEGGDDEEMQSPKANSRLGSGRSTAKAGSGMSKRGSAIKRTGSPNKVNRKGLKDQASNENTLEPVEAPDEGPVEEKIHKYVIQAHVLRDSWPLTKSQWDFVDELKVAEKNDNEVPAEPVNKPDTSGKGSAGKGRKGKDARDSKGGRSRPESQIQQSFDDSKPHWVLRVVLDASVDNFVDIKKDTERQDEIKAMKAAWESAEPGRAEKAVQSRMKFLKQNTVDIANKESSDTKESGPASEDIGEATAEIDVNIVDSKAESNAVSTTSPVPSEITQPEELLVDPPIKEKDTVLKYFDTTPYIRSTGVKVYLDSTEERRREEDREKRFADFQQMREKVLEMREQDRVRRNELKERQLAEYERMQLDLDQAREKLFAARESYRQKYIEKPEEEPIADSADPTKKRSPSPKRRSSKTNKAPSRAGLKAPSRMMKKK